MRNLIVLSDGTGNSAAATNKTNVWRLYEALDLINGSQIATFGDGVGTSTFRPLQILGQAFGVGVKRNVLRLYKFLCRNYTDDDRIWCFGFSRGAFTVRVLAGLIQQEGLISFKSEEELDRSAVAAYRAYRKKAFHTNLPWVIAGRWVRDLFIHYWYKLIGARPYDEIKKETFERKRHIIQIHFLGVWDTVVAYGLPIDELTQAVDKWVWPMNFRDKSLLANVNCARHALSIDDDRRTFFPIPWDEDEERKLLAEDSTLPRDRLLQVWFVGVHANVGGGYPDDSLAYVPLCWMIEQTISKGLHFRPEILAQYVGRASPTGRKYDARAGVGLFYRYQPRDAQALMGKGNRPIAHHSLVTRMALGYDGYAPISLPYDIDILTQYGPAIAFNAAEAASLLPTTPNARISPPPADQALLPGTTAQTLQENKERLLENIIKLDTANAKRDRAPVVKLVLDTVWWRRVLYFVSLFLALFIVAYPLLAPLIHRDWQDELDNPFRALLDPLVGLIKGVLPGYAEPWIAAIVARPAIPLFVITLFAASLGLSRFLQRRTLDRCRAAWRVQARVDGQTLNRLRLTGQRRASTICAIFFSLVALFAWRFDISSWLTIIFAMVAGASLLVFARRVATNVGEIDANHPGIFLSVARYLRTSAQAVMIYRWCARGAVPAIFLFSCTLGAVAWINHASFDLLNTVGTFCKTDSPSENWLLAGRSKEILFDTKSFCQPTGVWLVEGRRYRLTMTVEDDWFDQTIWTDVHGMPSAYFVHYIGFPLKRWWTKNWFQPIARVNSVGNYEYPLDAVAPLPDVPIYKCSGSAQNADGIFQRIRQSAKPATQDQRALVKNCGGRTLTPAKTLIADIVPQTSGELFLYVNDAALLWPGRIDFFYRNNSGKAKVTVFPVLADTTVPVPNE
jgi:uncharacterized protein (DUF2235 family)